MAPKKTKTESQPKEKPFRTTAFTALKGLVIQADKAVASISTVIANSSLKPIEDDGLLFLQAMEGICRFDSKDKSVENKVQIPPIVQVCQDSETSPAAFMLEIKRLKLDVTFTDEKPTEYELKPLSSNRSRQLKRGTISVSAQLDLHGLTKDEAFFELPRFLASARNRNESAVLVITGKGNNSIAEPILQQAVASWLRDGGRSFVSEFAPAPREMGGNGAFVVFLKKLKTSC